MGWSVGFDSSWHRDIGYGVPAECDHPDCTTKIDRGLSYVCGSEPYGGDQGCGLYFCSDHLQSDQVCERCTRSYPKPTDVPFTPKPDVREWVEWKLTDESWARWRTENTAEAEAMRASLATAPDGRAT